MAETIWEGYLDELRDLGNVPKQPPTDRAVFPGRCIQSPKLVLKTYAIFHSYAMHIRSQDYPDYPYATKCSPRQHLAHAAQAIQDEYQRGRITPYSGMGFAIIDENMLGVFCWHHDHADVLVPRTYVKAATWEPTPIEEIPFLTDPIRRIWNFEQDEWRLYRHSPRADQDKHHYLTTFYDDDNGDEAQENKTSTIGWLPCIRL